MKVKIFVKSIRSGVNAKAVYDVETKECVVQKGSVVSENISSSPKFRGAKTVIAQRQEYVVDRVVKKDVVFRSASTAANFVTGSSTNGMTSWKNEDGIKLKELL